MSPPARDCVWRRCGRPLAERRPRRRTRRDAACDVPRGIAGRTSAARSPMIASTQTTSISVNPASASVVRHYRDALLIRLCESPTPPAPLGIDLVRRMIARNLVEIGMTPRIHGHRAGLEVGPVPGERRRRTLDQRSQTFICRPDRRRCRDNRGPARPRSSQSGSSPPSPSTR